MRSVVQSMAEGLIVRDASGIITDCNAAAEQIVGLGRDRLRGRRPEDVLGSAVDADDRPVSGGRLLGDAALSTGDPQAPVTARLTRPDGTPVWVWFSSAPVLDAGGEPEGVVSTMSDVTQSREAEQRLVASEQATRALADEQVALRRIATLVASEAPPSAVFEQVTAEVAHLLHVPSAGVLRYENDSSATVVGSWRDAGLAGLPLGSSVDLDGDSVVTRVFRSGRPARIDNYDDAPGALAEQLRGFGYRSSVAAPVSVGARLWGVLVASATESERLVSGSERRLSDFADLVAQALSNADAYDKLAGSRARIVEAGDAERRRLERNLHDGAQQRLVSLALQLRMVEGGLEANPDRARQDLAAAREQLKHALDELRELARGIHPAILTDGGLAPALSALAHRATLPVEIDDVPDERLPEPVEAAAYYLIAEAITNVAKHAHASHVSVSVLRDNGRVLVRVADDGVGGADPGRARGSTVSPTVSRRSMGNSASTAHPAVAHAWRRASRSDEGGGVVWRRPCARGGLARAPVSTELRPLGVDRLRAGARRAGAGLQHHREHRLEAAGGALHRAAGARRLRGAEPLARGRAVRGPRGPGAGVPARGARRWSDRRRDRGDRPLRHVRVAALPGGRQRRAVDRGARCSARSSCTWAAAATRPSCSARSPGWRAPRCGPSSGPTPRTSRLTERRWWPLALGIPGMFALWIVPDWLGSGDLLHTFHLARISAEPVTLQQTSSPALDLLRGTGTIAPAPVWIGALCGLAFGWRTRDRTVAALALVAAAWAGFTVAATALGYPAVPRYLVGPVAICCVLAGIGVVAVVRLASRPRNRAVLAAALLAVSVPFAVSRAVGLYDQAADSKARAATLSALWRAADRAKRRAPIARLHPIVQPGGLENGLAWKLDLQLDDVGRWFSPAVGVAFIEGDDAAVIARLRRRNATAVRLTAAGPWRVLLVRWGSQPSRSGAP